MTMIPEPNTVSRPITQVSVLQPRVWDRLGTLLSGLCLVHCLLVPAALVALPGWTLLGTVHEAAHGVLALVLLPVTLVAARHSGSGNPQEVWAARLLWTGLGFVWLALPAVALPGEIAEIGLTVVGSVTLMAGHLSRLNHQATSAGRHHDECA